MTDRNLSPHFRLAELCRTSVRLPNEPTDDIVANLTELCAHVLEPLREAVVAPIWVHSGYRSPAVNTAVHGAKNSQHVQGRAADITVHGMSNFALARTIADHLPFDQLILEFVDTTGLNGWVHVSYRSDGSNRGQILAATLYGGKPVYQTIGKDAIPRV